MKQIQRVAVAATVLPIVVLASAPAEATPQPLPFTYIYETLPKGSLEVEQYADLTTIKTVALQSNRSVTYADTQLQTEFEYGITDRLELGLYVTFQPGTPADFAPAPQMTEGNGLKERLRVRLADSGQWPVDVGLYGELVENEHEIEIEAKIILQRRLGNLRLVSNLWAESEFEYAGVTDWVINPTLGATYQVTPAFHPGVESWVRAEWSSDLSGPRPFEVGPHVYVGPTAMVNFGNFWFSTGVYLRATDFGHRLQPGESYGSVWARMIIGLAF